MLSGSQKYPRRVTETTARLLLPGRGSRAWRCRLSPCPGQLAPSGLRSSGIPVPSGGLGLPEGLSTPRTPRSPPPGPVGSGEGSFRRG